MPDNQDLKEIIYIFSEVIQSYEKPLREQQGDKEVFRMTLYLKDKSKIKIYEALAALSGKLKYHYQWMDENNRLIIRWDNDLHHPEISTHPYHKHVDTEENVQPSEEMNLATVLAFIAKTLLVLAFLVTIRQIFVS